MINVEQDISALKQYYDSLAWYQRLFFPKAIAKSLTQPPITPLQLSLTCRADNSFFYRFFGGLRTFSRSDTFVFYTNLFDRLRAFNLDTSDENFNIVLAAEDSHRVSRDINHRFNQLIEAQVFPGEVAPQRVYQFLASHPAEIECIALSMCWLKRADMLTANNMEVLENIDRGGLGDALKQLFDQGLLISSARQQYYDALISLSPEIYKPNWAYCLVQLAIAGVLTDGVDLSRFDVLGLAEANLKGIGSILGKLNENKCPITQERFDLVASLSFLEIAILSSKLALYRRLNVDFDLEGAIVVLQSAASGYQSQVLEDFIYSSFRTNFKKASTNGIALSRDGIFQGNQAVPPAAVEEENIDEVASARAGSST